jgi:hypothetical protein
MLKRGDKVVFKTKVIPYKSISIGTEYYKAAVSKKYLTIREITKSPMGTLVYYFYEVECYWLSEWFDLKDKQLEFNFDV